MPSDHRRRDILLHALPYAAAWPFLWCWTFCRLWPPLGGALRGLPLWCGAAVLVALLLALAARAGLPGRFLLPWGRSWKTLLAGAAGFGLGFLFDLSQFILGGSIPLAILEKVPYFTLCRVGGGILTAVLLLALLGAVRDMKGLGRLPWKWLLLIALAVNAATALYSFTSQTVYVWDAAGYWYIARSLAEGPLPGYQVLRTVWETTATLDYNYLLALPVSLVMRLFGGSRTVFLFAISNLYTLPALWGLAVLGRERDRNGLVLCALFPMVVYIGLVGFVDTACCGLAVWAYVVYTSDRPAASRGIVTGVLLVTTFLLRRYFFFFAASFGVAALVKKLLFERKDWGDFLSLFGSCALSSLLFTYSFLLEKVLGTDYGDIYSAYKSPLKTDLLSFCRYFGLVFLLLLFVLALWALFRGRDRPAVTLALVQTLLCFAVFAAVQSHGQQHLLLYVPGLALLAVTCLPALPRFLPGAMAAVITLNCFIPKAQPTAVVTEGAPALLPSFHFYGTRRSDIDELLALSEFVDSLSTPEETATAVVLASSFTLNSETLTHLRPSLGLEEPEAATIIQYHGTVDKRDPFNWNTATADYLIIGDPIQVHLGEENQQVMALLARQVLEGTGAGAAYEELPETFTLEGGVTVRIFRRTRLWTLEEYYAVSRPLMERYPEHADSYRIPYWLE